MACSCFLLSVICSIKLHDCTAVGILRSIISQEVKDAILRKWGKLVSSGSQFFRAIVNEDFYYSKSYYHRIKTRNNYTVCYEDEGRRRYVLFVDQHSTRWLWYLPLSGRQFATRNNWASYKAEWFQWRWSQLWWLYHWFASVYVLAVVLLLCM